MAAKTSAKAADMQSPSPSVVSMVGGGRSMTQSKSSRGAGKKHIRRIEITPSANKGMTITHHYASGPDQPYSEPKDHVFTRDQFHSHVVPHLRRHLGAKKEVGATGEASDAGE